MGYVSAIGIAIISKEKAVFELIQQDFLQSQFYKNNTETAKAFLDLFQDKQKDSYHLMVAHNDYIKWYSDFELAWEVFSEICDNFNLAWCFIRIGEEYGDIEEDNNYHKLNGHDDLLRPCDIFGFIQELHCFV